MKPWDEVSLPCSSIAVESAILDPHVLRNDQSMLAFYVDTLYEEVDSGYTTALEDEVLLSLKVGGDGDVSPNFKPKNPLPVSKQDLQNLRDKIEGRINFLEHEKLMCHLRSTWGPHADGYYPDTDEDYVFLSIDNITNLQKMEQFPHQLLLVLFH